MRVGWPIPFILRDAILYIFLIVSLWRGGLYGACFASHSSMGVWCFTMFYNFLVRLGLVFSIDGYISVSGCVESCSIRVAHRSVSSLPSLLGLVDPLASTSASFVSGVRVATSMSGMCSCSSAQLICALPVPAFAVIGRLSYISSMFPLFGESSKTSLAKLTCITSGLSCRVGVGGSCGLWYTPHLFPCSLGSLVLPGCFGFPVVLFVPTC